MRNLLMAWLALGLAACQTPPTPPAAPPFTLIDLTGAYGSFYDRTAGMPVPARVDAFKVQVAPLFPGFYDYERFRAYATPERHDARIARSFETYPALRPGIERTSSSFVAMLEPARDAFVLQFPDMAPIGDIYLVHSLGEMDGGTRTIDGRRYFVFGADVMARIYTPGDERPFFQHELFHIYHDQFFQGCDEVWCSLWREGLAVYVSEQLNPGATDLQMGLTIPRPIRPEVDANLPKAVCAVRERLRSTRREDYAPLFQGQAQLEGLPPRAGYYVGYLVVREAGRTRSLQQLAHLPPEQARPVVEAALATLARCPV